MASDCLEINGRHYVGLVDIYSDFIELSQLPDLNSNALIKAIKPVFATHGAPVTLITDNGINFISSEFRRFLKSWDVNHITSSPHHHQSNGRAEAAVKLMKGIIKKLQKKELTCGKPSWNGAMQPHQACAVHPRNDSYQGAPVQCYHAKPRTTRPKYKSAAGAHKIKTDNQKLLWPACQTITGHHHRTTYQGEASSTNP